jgi:hypothetical protein|nr:hypothetical protein [Kofleriaceae bacterium]
MRKPGLLIALVGVMLLAVARPSRADDLSLIPVDSDAVLGLNWHSLSASQAWKDLIAPKLASNPDAMANLDKFKALCGFDPMSTITSVTMGLKGIGQAHPDGVVVVHGLDKTKSKACFDKKNAEKAPKDAKVTVDGDVVLVTGSDGQTVAFMFADQSTLLVVVGSQATKDGIAKVAKGGSALKTSAAFTELYKKVNTSDTLWFLINGSAFAGKMPSGVNVKALFGSVNVTAGVAGDVRARMDSAATATSVTSMAQSQVQGLSSFVDKIAITADGSDVHIVAAMSETKLKSLASLMGMGASGGSKP